MSTRASAVFALCRPVHVATIVLSAVQKQGNLLPRAQPIADELYTSLLPQRRSAVNES
jgi:hypothetical protein